MELRRYWEIVWRRWPVVLAVPLLVAAGSLALFLSRPVSYTAKARVQLMLVPQQADERDFFRYDNYYTYLATEYAADDLVEVLNGNQFTDAVARTLQGPDFNLPIGVEQIRGALDVTRKHRVLQIEATTGEREWAVALARAATVTLQRDPLKYFSRGDSGVKLDAAPLEIDQPLAARSNRVRSLFNIAVQTLLGLVAGVGLAFLLEYLDDTLRSTEAARETLGLPVLGQIPGGGQQGRRARAALPAMNGRRAA
jgi:capsular polysaccharide biosynthesis protein